jgi:D-alanyl-D-alanine carboxypeptidase/D-alanyl-D-alanine-endopeptidase (penicillin-binding protein 4)
MIPRLSHRWRIVLLAAPLAACGPSRPSTAPQPSMAAGVAALRSSIDSMVSTPEFRNAHWGILIVDPSSGDTLYSRNAGKLFMPASNMKIITSATALAQLGPDHRFATTLATDGAVRDGVVLGNVVVRGSGDPTVSTHMRGDAMAPLREIADSLMVHGIRRIAGRLVSRKDAFPGPTLGYGWSWEDLEESYSAPIAELLFNEGFSIVTVRGGMQPGDPAFVTTAPARTFPLVRASVITVSTDSATPVGRNGARRRNGVRVVKDTAFGGVVVDGWIAAGDSVEIEVTHRDPVDAYLAALTEALRDAGIVVEGRLPPELPPAGQQSTVLFTAMSPPLSEILPPLMKPSQNQIAEMLLRAVGLQITGVGTADSGRAVARRQLEAWGAPTDGFILRDGSGLSRYDYLSPETIVHVLDAMRKAPTFQLYYDALPIAGTDGTIRTRMRGTPAEGNLHAKTGTIANARSLSGYVTTADGRMLIFSLLCNNFSAPVATVTQVQDVIGAALASLGSTP